MPPRKTRAQNPRGSSKTGTRKRVRRDSSPEVRSASQPRNDEQQEIVPQTQQSVKSWSSIIASIEAEAMSSQIQRYKDWKRHGSIHETTCCVCFDSGALKPCYTCRLAFHVDCIPRDSLYKSSDLFCSICVNRGWHVSPPELTPPPSPTLGPTPRPVVAVDSEPVVSVSRTMSIPNLVSSAFDPRPRPPSSTMQASQEAVSDSLHCNQTSDHVHRPPTTTINHSPPRHTQISDDNNNNNSVEPARPKRQRKSRYATLSSEVDASLAVLYHELESIASLKAQVEDLQNQTLRDAQVIKLRENSIAILRRDLEQRRTAEQEMVQFRAMKPQYDSLQRELDEVRAKNAALEFELQESREETAAAKETVNDWKGKLSQLLGN